MKKKKQKEKCVQCGKDTQYYKDDHVDMRDGYIEGVGQLCLLCFTALRG